MLNFVLTAETPEELTEAWDIANFIGYAPGVEDFNRADDTESQAVELVREDGVTRTFSLEVDRFDGGLYFLTGYVWEDTQDGEHLDAGGDAIECLLDAHDLVDELTAWAQAGE